jgi:Phosphomethylpyrimidine kinase
MVQLMVYPIGMLASAETIKVVAETLREWQQKTKKDMRIVLDPVFLSFHSILPTLTMTGHGGHLRSPTPPRRRRPQYARAPSSDDHRSHAQYP